MPNPRLSSHVKDEDNPGEKLYNQSRLGSQEYDNLNTYHMGAQDLQKPWRLRASTHLEIYIQVVMLAPALDFAPRQPAFE